MAKPVKGELVILGFDYSPLDTKIAEKARSAADRIRERLTKTLEDLIEVGSDLLEVKEALPHGQFGPWLKAEFGWSERTAQNFMSVAERFKSANFAELPIQPSAAYMLAAPAVPDEARQVAIEKAEAGETITFTTAKEIVAEAKKKGKKRAKAIPADQLGVRLVKVLERYRKRWNQKELAELAKQLREFADDLEKPQRPTKKKAKE
jgi:hypothetical protein